jgi:hypothetical protein
MIVNLPVVIDPLIKDYVLNFVDTSDSLLWTNNTAGNTFNRKFCALNKHNLHLTKIIKEYSKYVYSLFNITQQIEEEHFGNFIGYNSEGGFVHPHTDRTNSDGWEHVRINFLISKPYQGGNPIIQNKEYNIMEDNAWFNLASRWVHSSTPVIGSRARIVLSLGAYINPSELNEAKIY